MADEMIESRRESIQVDPYVISDALEKCCLDDERRKEIISLKYYLIAYKELSRFFHSLGTVFGFVASDVDSKIKILDSYRADENIGSHYETLKSMVEYEEKENLLRDKKRPSGARTILRLHRALKFFSTFIREVSLVEDSACTGPLARECYKKTLAKYHTWLIQKTASVAMYALPTRDGLVEKAFLKTDFESSGDKQAEWKRHSDEMDKMAKFADRVYDLVDEYFNEKNLHDLP